MKDHKIIGIDGNDFQDAPEFPASKAAHWPSGTVFACDAHAQAIVRLGNVLGMDVPISYAPAGAQCKNCINESRKSTNDSKDR